MTSKLCLKHEQMRADAKAALQDNLEASFDLRYASMHGNLISSLKKVSVGA